MTPRILRGRIGLALGSGASRGWAHLGVIRELHRMGIHPTVVCGSSAGAIAGAVMAAGELDGLERWGRQLDRRQVRGLFDLTLRGGIVGAKRLMERLHAHIPDCDVTDLPMPFACIATDLETGQEVWFREGSLREAVRASIAIPGFVSPSHIRGRWLVDGGVADPVPVSLCRALGADSVIAVDLNTTLLGRRFSGEMPAQVAQADASEDEPTSALWQVVQDVRHRLGVGESEGTDGPGVYDVISNSIEIMQVRITRSRMAGDPPELLVAPRLGDFAMLDFHRAVEAIEEGTRAVARALATDG